MVRIEMTRDEAEALWDLLMERPSEMVHGCSRGQLARAVATGCGFSHDAAVRALGGEKGPAGRPRVPRFLRRGLRRQEPDGPKGTILKRDVEISSG